MYLLSKYGKDGSGGVTGFEADGEWVCEKIVLCAFSVCVQGIPDYYLKFGGRCGRRLRMRHEHENREFEDDGGYSGDSWAEGVAVVHRDWAQPASCCVRVFVGTSCHRALERSKDLIATEGVEGMT